MQLRFVVPLAVASAALAAWFGVAHRGTEPRPPASLAAACWPAATLHAAAQENVPRRNAPGSRLPVPELLLPRPSPAALRGSIRRVALPPGVKLVALTFDAGEFHGEVAGYDGSIVDYLRENRVPATFFVGGKWLITHAERAAQLLADPLFEMGNHTWTHRNLRKLDARRIAVQIDGAEAAYQHLRRRFAGRPCAATGAAAMAAIPQRMTLFRFPFGTCNEEALRMVGDAGMLAIQWDVVSGDPDKNQSAERIARTILRHTRPGSIIVAHANGRGWNTARALPLVVPRLRAEGYRFVTVSELLAAGTPVIVDSCYEWRPDDNLRY